MSNNYATCLYRTDFVVIPSYINFPVPKNVNFLQTMLTSAKFKEFWEYKVYFLKLHMWFVRFRKDLRFRNYKTKVFSIILTSFNKGELGCSFVSLTLCEINLQYLLLTYNLFYLPWFAKF